MNKLNSTIYFLTILIVLNITTGLSQAPPFQWAKGFGGNNDDHGNSAAVDKDGNVYVTGEFRGTVDFDPGLNVYNLSSSGMQDIFISKYNASGNFIWAIKMGGSQGDEGKSLVTDGNNNIYVTGVYTGTVDFDPGSGTSNLSPSGSNRASFVCKFSSSGSLIWAGTIPGEGNSLAIDSTGYLYIGGEFSASGDFNPGAGTYNLSVNGIQNDAYVCKLDTAGAFVWAKKLGGLGTDRANGIAVDVNSNVYTTGEFEGTADFDPSGGTANLSSQSGSRDIFISKLNASGAYQWAKRIGGSGVSDYANDITVDPSGNVIICGSFYGGNIDFNPGAGTNNLSGTLNHGYVCKLNSAGDYVWAKAIGGSSDDFCHGISSDNVGNLYISGEFKSTVDFNPGGGTYNQSASGSADVFVLKLNNSGSFVWVQTMGGSDYDFGSSVVTDGTGNIISTGSFAGNNFDPGSGSLQFVSEGGWDIFIQKMGDCSTPSPPANTTSISNLSICYGSNTTLSASGNGTLSWYDAASGGNFLGNGSNYQTPDLTNSTTYYVQDSTCNVSPTRTEINVIVDTLLIETNAINACDSIKVLGDWYFNSTTFNDTMFGGSINGCDSIVIYNLIVNYSDSTFEFLTSCIPTDTGVVVLNLSNQFGCDSVHTITTTLLSSDSTFELLTSCNPADTGMVILNLNNQYGCDSVHTITTTFLLSDSTFEFLTSCNPADTGVLAINLTNMNGCDSVHTITTTLLSSDSTFEFLTSCNPADTGVTVINLSNQFGCDSVHTQEVTLIQKAMGVDIQNACNTYTWIDGNTYTSSNNTAIFNIIGGASNGCDSLISLDLTINSVDVSVTDNSPTLTANTTGASYKWLDCDNNFTVINQETTQEFTPNVNGNYAVEITQNGCTDTSACFVVNTVGIERRESSVNRINIYPNPSNGIFKIEHYSNENLIYEITDINGKIILKGRLLAKSSKIDLLNQSAGLYFIRVTFNGFVNQVRKIIIR